MKKIAILFMSLLCLFGVYFFYFSTDKMISPLSSLPLSAEKPLPATPVSQKETASLFVPYWSFTNKEINTNDFDSIMYFGISADENGVDTEEQGYKKLAAFNDLTPANTHTFLTVRMTNSSVNSKVLEDENVQQKIIRESIAIAKKYNFSGIVFDFEINALAFPSVVTNITNFYKAFYLSTKKNNLAFHVTLYGDTFYRARPYDVKSIAAYTDKILIMSYDYHKSRGDPGPNFPLSGKETFGYDVASMVSDFSIDVPREKLVIVFGLFGYDWEVDGKNQSVKNGVPLSFLEIKKNFLDSCVGKNCQSKRDSLSQETKITYTDENGREHIVWFEDEESVAKKRLFLQSKGIKATSIWAYSYY